MKKIILSGIACLALLTVTSSCKKNWVCRCDIGTTFESSSAIPNKTKKNAEEICEGNVKVGLITVSGSNNCFLD